MAAYRLVLPITSWLLAARRQRKATIKQQLGLKRMANTSFDLAPCAVSTDMGGAFCMLLSLSKHVPNESKSATPCLGYSHDSCRYCIESCTHSYVNCLTPCGHTSNMIFVRQRKQRCGRAAGHVRTSPPLAQGEALQTAMKPQWQCLESNFCWNDSPGEEDQPHKPFEPPPKIPNPSVC